MPATQIGTTVNIGYGYMVLARVQVIDVVSIRSQPLGGIGCVVVIVTVRLAVVETMGGVTASWADRVPGWIVAVVLAIVTIVILDGDYIVPLNIDV